MAHSFDRVAGCKSSCVSVVRGRKNKTRERQRDKPCRRAVQANCACQRRTVPHLPRWCTGADKACLARSAACPERARLLAPSGPGCLPRAGQRFARGTRPCMTKPCSQAEGAGQMTSSSMSAMSEPAEESSLSGSPASSSSSPSSSSSSASEEIGSAWWTLASSPPRPRMAGRSTFLVSHWNLTLISWQRDLQGLNSLWHFLMHLLCWAVEPWQPSLHLSIFCSRST
mmetsp:Transcript_18290/g.52538  ORF Transcript_18290/g.52538 Transcript_18290/m.52538 type:complete len:227 (-) Transcript_18290:328-1008(-)